MKLLGREVEVGDMVWVITRGWKPIIAINPNLSYAFDIGNVTYDSDGKQWTADKFQSIYFEEMLVVDPNWYPEIGELISVTNNCLNFFERKFVGMYKENVIVERKDGNGIEYYKYGDAIKEEPWIENSFETFPNVGLNDMVEVKKMNGNIFTGNAGGFWWGNQNSDFTIAYWRMKK